MIILDTNILSAVMQEKGPYDLEVVK